MNALDALVSQARAGRGPGAREIAERAGDLRLKLTLAEHAKGEQRAAEAVADETDTPKERFDPGSLRRAGAFQTRTSPRALGAADLIRFPHVYQKRPWFSSASLEAGELHAKSLSRLSDCALVSIGVKRKVPCAKRMGSAGGNGCECSSPGQPATLAQS
jgi:hypothetical protein